MSVQVCRKVLISNFIIYLVYSDFFFHFQTKLSVPHSNEHLSVFIIPKHGHIGSFLPFKRLTLLYESNPLSLPVFSLDELEKKILCF